MQIESEEMANTQKQASGKAKARATSKSTDAVGSSSQTSPIVVTIDGPAASGKSSVSRELAKRFGWNWVSTGSFYRGVAWAANFVGLDLENEKAMAEFVASPRWEVRLASDQTLFFFDGVDRTEDIAKEAVGSLASKISSYPLVRLALLEAQRDCAKSVEGLIAEGRDCGSVVFPGAVVKVFLTARAEDRAQRRALEEGRSVEAMISEQVQRDHQDASRKTAPMRPPEGAAQIDTTVLSLSQVVEKIEGLIRLSLEKSKSLSR